MMIWAAYEYCSEPSIVPCSIIIPPPNFQKSQKFWKYPIIVSLLNFEWQLVSLRLRLDLQHQVQQLNWKFGNQSLEQSCCPFKQPNASQSSGKCPTPFLASVDPSMIGESLLCYCCLNNLNKQAFNLLKKSFYNLSPQDITSKSHHNPTLNSLFVSTKKSVGLNSAHYGSYLKPAYLWH